MQAPLVRVAPLPALALRLRLAPLVRPATVPVRSASPSRRRSRVSLPPSHSSHNVIEGVFHECYEEAWQDFNYTHERVTIMGQSSFIVADIS